MLLAVPSGYSANIIWVSDLLPIGSGTSDNTGGTANGVFGPGPGPYADQGVINLLTSVGHSVTRFNPADSATVLSAGELTQLNAADLIIVGRSIGSGSFDAAAETLAWNTLITKPMINTNSYLTRNSRLGWFVGSNLPDQVAHNLTFTNPADPVSAYIIGTAAMTGNTTTNSITEAIVFPDAAVDARGISIITDAAVPGATEIATSVVGAATGRFIVSLPAGTVLGAGAGPSNGQVLGGYRMHFLIGNRESGTAPNNTVGSAGFENLTPEGEGMFLRAVEVALHNGAVPEPTTAALLLLGAGSLLRRRRSA
jgi:hypothetical protein